MKIINGLGPSLLILALCAGVSQAEVITLNGRTHCHTGSSVNGVTRMLSAGTHYLTLSGAYSFWSSDGQNGGLEWITNVRVHDLSSGATHAFGSGNGFEASAAAAAAAVAGLVFEFEMPEAGDVRFYLRDGGGCGDNRGNVHVDLDDPAVPAERQTWSSLKTAYR